MKDTVKNKMLKKNILSFLFIFIAFVIDRISKILVIKFEEPLGEMNIQVISFLNLNLIWNEGIAFGLLSFDHKSYYSLLTFIICLITLILIWFM